MRNVLRALGLGAVVVALGGCWPAPGAGPDRRSHNPFENRITVETVATLAPLWTAPLDHGPAGAPVVSTRGVHVVDGSSLYGFDTRTGARRWKNPPAPQPYEGMYQPVVIGGRLLAGRGESNSRIHNTVWFDPATGAETGVLAGTGHVSGVRMPTILLQGIDHSTGGSVVTFGVVDANGGARGNGGTIEFDAVSALPLTLGRQRVYHAGPGMPGPGIVPDRWYSGVRAFALEPTPETCGPEIAPFFACPLWTTELDGAPTTAPVLAADESTVYAGTSAGGLYALAATDGHILWQAQLGSAVTAPPALADGTLFVPVADGRLVALDAAGCGAATCPALWSAPVGGKALQPAVAGGVVFVGTDTGDGTGTVEAFVATGCGHPTCAPAWAHDLDEPATGAPAVANGHLYVGTGLPIADTQPATGHLVAFAPT
jgi:outer membrane protein assembly factor BamB